MMGKIYIVGMFCVDRHVVARIGGGGGIYSKLG